MSKKSFQMKSSKVSSKYGNILSFVQHQPASNLLKSKDGLKQGRIEAFMQKKTRENTVLKDENLLHKKKRQLAEDDVIKATPSSKIQKRTLQSSSVSIYSSPTASPHVRRKCDQSLVVDLTNETDSIIKKKSKAKKSLCNEMKCSINANITTSDKTKNIEEIDLSKDCDQMKIHCHKINEKMTDRSVEREKSTNSSLTSCKENVPISVLDSKNVSSLSVDDLGLDDSFLNSALDGLSPVKDNFEARIKTEYLPCAVPCTSTSHSLVKFRFFVLEVVDETNPSGMHMKTLTLENVSTKSTVQCELHHGWADTKVFKGDIVNLIADDNNLSRGRIKVDMKDNLLVVHPDILLSGTTVSNAIGCKRRAILNERFRNTESSDVGKPVMLIGTIVHTIFQNIVQTRQKYTAKEILAMAETEVSKPSLLKDILSLGTTQKDVLNGVSEFIPKLLAWTGEFVRDSPTVGVGRLDMNLPLGFTQKGLSTNADRGKFTANIALSEVKDIEENVWSPMLGLKGKIDLTGGFLIKRQTLDKKSTCIKLTLPLELKTGRESHSTEHHAQVAIYSMFCEERRKNADIENSAIPAGLLLYLKTGNLSCVPLKRDDKRELTMIRNEVATYMTRTVLETTSTSTDYEASSLPPTIDNERFCKNCSQLRNCALVHKATDIKHSTYNPSAYMQELINEQSSHLEKDALEYFNHWVTCTLLETRKAMKKDLSQYYWLRSPQEREEAGLCVSNLVLAGHGKKNNEDLTMLQTFKKSAVNCSQVTSFGIFSEGDMIIVSGSEPAFIAMATGTISSVSDNFITIVTDRNFDGYQKNMKYSIDKHEWPSLNSFKSSFHNLSVIMQPTLAAACLRKLVIHHSEPTFNTNLQDVIPRSSKDNVAKMLRGLNRTQRQAIKRVLLSKDYTLVVGMPGSGKTTTIVAMVRILILCGCRVLLTSYTHSAIDNLLLKLIKYKVKFLRLGKRSQIHPSVRKHSEEELSKDLKTPEQLDALYSGAKVVGCTCLAVTSHSLFTSPGLEKTKRSRFDVCIVDEASQISQPACLAPLLHAHRFVLVGDHRQLPPLVRSRKAKSMGADESLFWRLSRHKPALCDLTLQYRMNSTIMQVSNFVTYEGRLECASDAVAKALVKLSNLNSIVKEIEHDSTLQICESSIPTATWLIQALDPMKPVLFLDTSNIEAYEQEIENGISNKVEAEILKTIIQHLIQAGCASENIGVIAPFRKQLKAIESSLENISEDTEKVEINTVDKYQGRDKNVILMSFVRSRSGGGELGEKKGQLLSDWRRLNVALTRAKHKMVLVGCQKTLRQYEPCKKLLAYLSENEMVITL